MNWKYVEWETVPGVKVPMMEDEQGNLLGTNKTVADTLQMSEEGVRKIYFSNREEFDCRSVSDSNAKGFLTENKGAFGIQRIRKDMRLWTDDDILTFCYRATGQSAIAIRRKFSKFLKEHSKRNYVTKEQHENLQKAMEAQAIEFEVFKDFVMQHLSSVDSAASLAGKALQLQKGTKPIRGLLN